MKKIIMILVAMFVSTMCYSQIELHKNLGKGNENFYYIVDTVRYEIHKCVVKYVVTKNKKNKVEDGVYLLVDTKEKEISKEIINNVEKLENGIYWLIDTEGRDFLFNYVVKSYKTPKETVKDIIEQIKIERSSIELYRKINEDFPTIF